MKWIARWMVVSLVGINVPVQAQTPEKFSETVEVPAPKPVELWRSCGVAPELWELMSVNQQATVCQSMHEDQRRASQLPPSYASYRPQEQGEPVSRGLAIAGVISILAGTSLVLHFGEDDVHVLGHTYCVSDYGDVDYGDRGSALQTKVGLLMIGSGVLMTWIGIRSKHVSVAPQVTKQTKSVTAKVVW